MSKKKVKAKQLPLHVFKESLIKVADRLGKLPQEVTRADYMLSGIKGTLSEWELRLIGGYAAAKEVVFPPEKNVHFGTAAKYVRSYRNKLEAEYGTNKFLVTEIIEVIKEVMKKNPLTFHKPVEPVKKTKTTIDRALMVHISDTHFGSNIAGGEMDNLNEFNWKIAARRMAFLMDQVVTYKPQYRDRTELIMGINGDIIAGVIHNQEWFADLLTTQFHGTVSILGQAISYAAQHFKKVRVVCTPGNHGRAFHKSGKDRATVHKWDSYENMIYVALREIMAVKFKNVEFVIPESPYAIINVFDHSFLQTHGDTVINVGNPGKNLNMKSINDQINKVNASILPDGQRFAAILVGHVHTPTIQLTESGTMMLINGCLSGIDPYAQSLGIFGNHPTQTLFEIVPEYAVGDIRLIQVKDGDKIEKLDKIITPPRTKF